MKKHSAILACSALLVLMAALMAAPIKEESATVDEPIYLSTGYSYWHGFRFVFNAEAPPLAKFIAAAPLLAMDVKLPPAALELLNRKTRSPYTLSWSWEQRPVDELYPEGRESWYEVPFTDMVRFGWAFLYGGANNADRLLAAGRWMQVALTALTGVAIFLWLRQLAGATAGVLGVALWAFNPLALAYGHLVLTDMGETLMLVLAIWWFATFLEQPSTGHAALCGLACGGALTMKFTGPVLAPILLVLAGLFGMTRKEWRPWGRHVLVIPLVAAAVVLAVYAPRWSPAPPLSPDQGTKLGVPTWFRLLRPILIPPDFFKGLALQTMHAQHGHPSFLGGQWRQTGWWYWFPVALALKLPLPWLLLTAAGLLLWLMGLRRFSFQLAVPWLAASVYLLLAMTGTINIGVRYVLPIIPLLAVGIASQLAPRTGWMRWGAWLCAGWLLLVACRAYPHFIEYFNEAAGGSSNGYRWLVDSNLDWGQDVKRLKHFLDEHAITNINLAYFGPEASIDYYGISGRRVTTTDALGMRSGTLVISATTLMDASWDWLRACHEPVARVGYTMFIYRLGHAETKERWEQRLRLNPNDARAHYNLGIVMEQDGEPGSAITHYEQALRIEPNFAMAHYNLAAALQGAGKIAEAIEHYRQVLRFEPDFAEAHNDLGVALMREGRRQEAINHYEQALRIEPNFAMAHYNLAAALQGAGKMAEAIEHYRQVLRFEPDFAEAHNDLGVALMREGRRQEAINHYEQALRIKPDYAEAHNNLAAALAQAGNVPEAIEHYEQALRLKPDFAEAHYNLGLALEKRGRTQEAIQHYEQALRIQPNSVDAQNALARARAGQ
jgi:tetratricopeptide (TPR) repeat protein